MTRSLSAAATLLARLPMSSAYKASISSLPGKADRVSGWNRMRRLLSHAGKPDRPGLYIARRCRYFWDTVPMLARDAKRIEDVDTTGPDHGADAIRYGCLRQDWAPELKFVREG